MLKQIIETTRNRVCEKKELYPVKRLEQSVHFRAPVVSLKQYLLRPDKSGIIAEFKRQSPSRGPINMYADVEKTCIEYMQAGASALSVVTEPVYFKGSPTDLLIARQYNYCPVLRKDFIVDSYQVIESRSMGADAILLIASVLTYNEIISLTDFAHNLGMEVMLEFRSESEMDKYYPKVDIVGINNRDLSDFSENPEYGISMRSLFPGDTICVAESAMRTAQDVLKMRKAGFNGFLIGSAFMEQARPGKACAELVKGLRLAIEKEKAAINISLGCEN